MGFRWLAAIVILLSGCAHTSTVSEYEAAKFRDVRYRLLRPQHVARGERYPLVVIFHGSGAIGTDNVSQIGPLAKSWAAPAMRDCYPAFVLVPQFRARSANYSGSGATMTSYATDDLRNALGAIDNVIEKLPIDRQRIVAIGFSMGGSAVWNALVLRPRFFATAVSVAGVPNRDALPILGRTRLLLVHGDADPENPFAAAAAAYEAAPKDRVEFLRSEGLGHEFPHDLITEPTLAKWLLGAPVCTTR